MRSLNLRVVIPSCMGLLLIFATLGITQLGNAGAQQNIDRSKLTPQAVLAQVANDESRPTPTNNTPVPGATATNTPKSTQTGGATNTATSSPTVTQTPSPTKTTGPGTPTATATNTAVPTNTPTATSSPTATNTPVTGSTNTPTPTNTPVTPTATSTPVTPTATPTSTGPILYAVSAGIGRNPMEGEVLSLNLSGAKFPGGPYGGSSSIEMRNVSAGGTFNTVSSSYVTYVNPNSIALHDFSFPTAGVYEFRVIGEGCVIEGNNCANGTSNAVSITVDPSACIAVGEAFYNLGASNNAPPNIKTLYTSHQVPCPGDMVTVRVGIDPNTPAESVTFQFAMNGCLAENPMTEVSPNTWEATVQYNGVKPISFGYRPNATNATGNTSYSKISTLGAPFWGCE